MIASRKTIMIFAVTAIMITCLLAPAVQSAARNESALNDGSILEEDTFKYVSLGDSTTAGYGLQGYSHSDVGFLADIEDTYPHMLTQYLEQNAGKTVDHVQLAMSGCRMADIRAILYGSDFEGSSGYPGDFWTYSVFSNGGMCSGAYEKIFYDPDYSEIVEEYNVTEESVKCKDGSFDMDKFGMLGEVFRSELTDADLITFNPNLDLVFSIEIPTGMMGESKNLYDFSLYIDAGILEMLENVECKIRCAILTIAETLGVDVEPVLDKIDNLVKGLAYGVISYCQNFDTVCKWIYENNPSAKVLSIDVYNICNGVTLDIVDGFSLDIGGLCQLCVDMANDYTRYISPYACKNYHVDVDDVERLADSFSANPEDITFDTKSAMGSELCVFDGESYSAGTTEAYNWYVASDANGNLTKLMQIVYAHKNMSVDSLRYLNENVLTKDMLDVLREPGAVVEETSAGGIIITGSKEFILSSDEVAGVFINLFTGGVALMLHPAPEGHTYIEGCIEDCIEKENVLSDTLDVIIVLKEALEDAYAMVEYAKEYLLSLIPIIRDAAESAFGTVIKTIDMVFDDIESYIESIGYRSDN